MKKNSEVEITRSDTASSADRPGLAENAVPPDTDVYETPEAFVLMLDMPGARKDDIHVSVEKGGLIVAAAIMPQHKENATFLSREILGKTYYREFNLGNDVDHNSIEAQFDLGVLTLKMYKSEELKPREIKIK